MNNHKLIVYLLSFLLCASICQRVLSAPSPDNTSVTGINYYPQDTKDLLFFGIAKTDVELELSTESSDALNIPYFQSSTSGTSNLIKTNEQKTIDNKDGIMNKK